MTEMEFLTHVDLGAGAGKRGNGGTIPARLRVSIDNLQELLREIAPGYAVSDIEHDVEELLPAVIALREAGQTARREELLRLFMGDAAPRQLDIARAKMQAEARKAVFRGTEWLTAAQIADLAGLGQKNLSGSVNRWKQKKQVFALPVNGQDWYPRYALDEAFRPRPEMAQVIAALGGWTAPRLASWFEAKSSTLGGERPRDVIAAEPARVVDAARRVATAEVHNG